ncbi:MAG: RDD family protein [Acidimicrobiia bacterium]
MSDGPAPGWYPAEGDPPGTHRFWNGVEWVGGPRPMTVERPLVHGRRIADPGKRIGAAIIDGIILALFAIPALLAGLRDVDWDAVAAGVAVPDIALTGGWVLVIAVFAFAYNVAAVALWGATPGKHLMKIEIIRQSDGGTPPGWMTAFVRYLPTLAIALLSQVLLLVSLTMANLVSNLSIIVQVASLVLIFSDRTRRSVYDMVGKTNVVDRIS